MEGEPGVVRLQCRKERSVCTVTSLAVDEQSVAAGLGSSGRVELWDREVISSISLRFYHMARTQ